MDKATAAWTNGFVERLQHTILPERWRVVFYRQYFTSRAVLHRLLQQFMRFCKGAPAPRLPHSRTHGGVPGLRHVGSRSLSSYQPLWDGRECQH